MARKTLNVAGSAIAKNLKAIKEAADRGELQSGLTHVIVEDQPAPAGVTLAPVTLHAVQNLVEHPLNRQYFHPLPAEEYETLKEDIQRRGVLVPVIATAAGVILSGHRRAQITRELGRTFIPVQFIKGELTADQEREFLIKDNLLRRQLTPAEKEALIVALYGNEIGLDRRGGDRKSAAAKSKFQREILIDDAKPETLPERIERETGGLITAGTAGRMVAKVNKARKTAAAEAAGEPAAAVTPAANPATDPLKAVRANLGKIVRLLNEADQRTIDAAIIEIVGVLDQIGGIDPRYSNQVKQIIENMRS